MEQEPEQSLFTQWQIDIVPLARDQAEKPAVVAQWNLQVRVLNMQEDLLRFLKYAQGIALAFTMPAFLIALFLNGFEKTGFKISDTILMFLGGATITGIAGLITTAITTFLKPPRDL